MKEWQVTFVGSIVMFAAGIVMLVWGTSLEIPTTYFGNNDYFLVSNQYFTVYLTGVLFIGFSGAFLICTLLIYHLEQKISKLEKPNQ